jgi:hypothetical protein
MTTRRDPDAILAAWLEEGPDVLPESTRRAIEVAARTTHQSRHPKWMTWRFQNMNGMTRLALAAAAVVAVAVGGLYLFRPATDRSGGVGGPGSPAPSASSSPRPSTSASPLNTAIWTTYTSSRYGFSIAHPADWTEVPADHDWTFENDIEAWQSTGVESFVNAEESVKTSAWSVATTPGTTVESWVQAYCAAQNPPCTGILDGAVDVETGDQHPGRLVLGLNEDTMAFFLDGQTMYVVAVWREDTDPSVRPYGGARQLLEAFCSTLTLPAEPPQGSPGPS